MPHVAIRRPRRPAALVALLAALTLASLAAAQSTWTAESWTDPDGGATLAAIVTPIEFGLEGAAVFACAAEGPGGLTVVFQAEELASAPEGDILMNYGAGSGDDVTEFASWARGEDGTTVRFAGTDAELATLIADLTGVLSPAFFWSFGPWPTSEQELEAAQAEGRVVVAVLESEGFAAALASLPCSAE